MGRFDHSDEDQKKIAALASKLIVAQIAEGKIQCTQAAIEGAVPQAVEDARQIINAANEYLAS